MKRIMGLVTMVAVLAGVGLASAQQPVTLAFATLSQGTAWFIYGATMAELLRKALPPGSNVDVKPFSGGVGNAKLVARNETPIGLSFTVSNRWAYEGKEAYEAKLDNLRGLVGGLDTYYLVAIAQKKLGVSSLREIKDKKLPVKLYTLPVGTNGEFGARQLLREYGVSYADLKSWGGATTHVGYNVIVDAIRDGRGDLLMAVITPKHPSITEIMTFADVKFLQLEPERVQGLTALGYAPATMPVDMFKNQPEPINAVGFPTVLITNASLPEPVAYMITKTIVENKEALVRGHAGLVEFEPKDAWRSEKVGLPLHPGAERYYREKGWMK